MGLPKTLMKFWKHKTHVSFRFNHAFGPHFRSKISIWSLYFFFRLNLVPSISGTLTLLKGVPRASSWFFLLIFELFLFFLFEFFLKK